MQIVFDDVKNYKLCKVGDGLYHVCIERISDISLLNIKIQYLSTRQGVMVIHCDDRDIIDTIKERYGEYCYV